MRSRDIQRAREEHPGVDGTEGELDSRLSSMERAADGQWTGSGRSSGSSFDDHRSRQTDKEVFIICGNCETEPAELDCLHADCGVAGASCEKLCKECDRVFHKAVAKRSHIRIPLHCAPSRRRSSSRRSLLLLVSESVRTSLGLDLAQCSERLRLQKEALSPSPVHSHLQSQRHADEALTSSFCDSHELNSVNALKLLHNVWSRTQECLVPYRAQMLSLVLSSVLALLDDRRIRNLHIPGALLGPLITSFRCFHSTLSLQSGPQPKHRGNQGNQDSQSHSYNKPEAPKWAPSSTSSSSDRSHGSQGGSLPVPTAAPRNLKASLGQEKVGSSYCAPIQPPSGDRSIESNTSYDSNTSYIHTRRLLGIETSAQDRNRDRTTEANETAKIGISSSSSLASNDTQAANGTQVAPKSATSKKYYDCYSVPTALLLERLADYRPHTLCAPSDITCRHCDHVDEPPEITQNNPFRYY